MAEKIYNNFTYFELCPLCKGDLRQYYKPIIKKFFGIKTSETYHNFFECSDCKKEFSIDFAILLSEQEKYEEIRNDGTKINYDIAKINKRGATKVKTTTSYYETFPVFTNEKLFIEILSRIIFIFNTLSNKKDIDFDKIEQIKKRFEKEIVKEYTFIQNQNIKELTLSLNEKYKVFCYENGDIASRYILAQGAKFVTILNFSPNKEQENILIQLLKIKGTQELEIQPMLLLLYAHRN